MLKTVSILGYGSLGKSMAIGFSKSNINKIYVSKKTPSTVQLNLEKIEFVSNNLELLKNSNYIVIAVKPYNFEEIIQEISPYIENKHILISTITGLKIEEIKSKLPVNIPVFRVMPNTTSEIKESINCIAGSESEENKKKVMDLFEKIGKSIYINEDLMNAATVLGACGIAYVLRFMRTLMQGGIQIGFDKNTSYQIVNQLVLGASKLLIEKETHPEEEIDKVTTPKGCTIVGLNEMEYNGFSASLIKGICASYEAIEK